MTHNIWIRRAAILTLTTAVLAGCGRDSDSGADDPSNDLTELSAGPATGDITVWAMGLEGESMPAIAEAFEAENPDANVTVTAIPWDDAPTKISTAIASGQTPDATLLNPDTLGAFVAAGGFASVPDGIVDESSFNDASLAATEVDGTSYSVPLYDDTRVLFYRKDMAERAGVAAPTEWNQLAPFAAALKQAGAGEGLLLPTGELGFTHQVLLPFVWQAGGSITNGDLTEFTMDTPEVIEGLSYYQSLFQDGVASDTGTYEPWGSVEERLRSGDIGSVINGPWLIGSLRELYGDDFDSMIGVSTVPAGPANAQSWLNGGQLAVFRDAQNPEGAWKFIRFLSEPDQAAEFSELTADLPSVLPAWPLAGLDVDPAAAVFSAQFDATNAVPALPGWAEISTIIDGYGEQLARGTITPEDAAAQMQSKLSGIGLE